MKLLLVISTVFLCSCTTCVPNEEYNCNRDGYSVDYSEGVNDDNSNN